MTDPTATILNYFEALNAIPRCSLNEAKVCQWLQQWATRQHLSFQTDNGGNLVVPVAASPGFENAPTVVLQGHMDMVCEKTPASTHDFAKDPIVSHREGEWLTAEETTLGADNGIAIAYMLALAQDPSIRHPSLELLFTVDEETGLNGAKALQPDFVKGRILINLDSEDEGVFTIGCAGGVDTAMSLAIERQSTLPGGQLLDLVVGGLKGGHSGIDIDKHRANANKIMARALAQVQTVTPLQLLAISGGSRKNAIPRDANATIWIDAADKAAVENTVAELEATIQQEYAHSDKALFIKIHPAPAPEPADGALAPTSTDQAIRMLLSLPNGVYHMSSEIEGMVDTSSNLATVSLEGTKLTIVSSQRSASKSRLREITAAVHAVARLAGATAEDHDAYPPWQPQMASDLLSRSKRAYRMLYGQEPVIQVIHAGLECAVIGDIYPGMDMISLGPTIQNPHSPDERIWIPSIEKVWRFLAALLAEMQN